MLTLTSGNPIITRSARNTGKALWPLINVRLRAEKVRFSQILEYSVYCINLSEGKKRRKKVTLGSRVYTIPSLWVVFSLSTLYLKTVDWSLTTRIKQRERNVVLGWAGVCGEGRNTSSPKNACVGGYEGLGCRACAAIAHGFRKPRTTFECIYTNTLTFKVSRGLDKLAQPKTSLAG